MCRVYPKEEVIKYWKDLYYTLNIYNNGFVTEFWYVVDIASTRIPCGPLNWALLSRIIGDSGIQYSANCVKVNYTIHSYSLGEGNKTLSIVWDNIYFIKTILKRYRADASYLAARS